MGFKKGNIPWNKNIKGIHLSPESEFKKGHLMDIETREKIGGTLKRKGVNKGNKNYFWKDGRTLDLEKRKEYKRLHEWLFKTFGKANKCENTECEEVSVRYEYSLLKGKKYENKRENFWMLCVSCHRNYDLKQQA